MLRLRACLIILASALVASCQYSPGTTFQATEPLPVDTPSVGGATASSQGENQTPQNRPAAGERARDVTAVPTRSVVFIPQVRRDPLPTSTPTPEIPTGANILFIVSDDQRFDTMEFMPRTQELIFAQGVQFSRAYITTPSCCPSRASILTGLYAHNHRVLENQDPLEKRTFVEDLHAAGYYTGIVGKYLNSWDGSMRPEFDFWVSFEGGASPYFDPELNVQGEWKSHSGYMTDILEDYALEFLDQALGRREPFFLLFTPNAPHEPAEPAPGDEELYEDLPLHRPPSFNEDDVSDKPLWLQEYDSLTDERIQAIDELRLRQIQTLNALDEAVERILLRLNEAGELDETFVVYISDNGFYWGEHRRRRGKGYAWEEAIRVPFAIRYPPLARQGVEIDRLVANLDLAPTVYQLAGLPAPSGMDGLSLIPLLNGDPAWRDRLVIENWNRFGPYMAVRTERFLYVEWDDDRPELYDSESDPYQLVNQVENPDYAQVVSDLRQYLVQTRDGAE